MYVCYAERKGDVKQMEGDPLSPDSVKHLISPYNITT